MQNIRQLYGFIITSKLREGVLKLLYRNKPLRQMEISKKINQKQQNISTTLIKLEKENLVECLTPNKKAWKVYSITELGKEVIKYSLEQKKDLNHRRKS